LRAIAEPFTEHVTLADDCPIHYVRWGDASKPPVLLIHGGGAHAFWWGFLAPILAERYSVIAMDLSGHGDSGRRERYPREVWSRDVLAVIADATPATRPFLVGHSMGGLVAVATAALHGERLSGAILVDAPIRAEEAPAPAEPSATGWSFQRMAPYPDFESAVRRFRLLPAQPTPHAFLLDYVAARSLRGDPDGFVWKFDPRVFEKASRSSLRDYFIGSRCRLALIRGAESVVLSRETADAMVALAHGKVPLVELPEAHHHVMLDQPLPLLAALRALLASWVSSSA
jgi:pimeloyl-ACP methyl ester carboxylesterase